MEKRKKNRNSKFENRNSEEKDKERTDLKVGHYKVGGTW